MVKSTSFQICMAATCLPFLMAPGAAMADHYKVSFSTARSDDDGALRLASVVARITPDGGRFRLTRASEDSGLYHGWAGFLTQIEAEDDQGRPIRLTYEVPGVWRLAGHSRGEVTVRYSLNLQHDRFSNEPGDNELAHAHSYGVMWTGRALFMEGAFSSDLTVEFELPPEWKVTTPWRRRPGSRWAFVPRDTDDLLDSAFMAGTHRQYDVDLGNAQAVIALGPPVQELGPVFQRLIRQYFSAYTKLFGDAPQDNFLLIGADASFLGGGVIGRTISLSLTEEAKTPPARQFMAHVIAHEGFHLWNVQWGDRNASWQELEWFKEGMAEYYAYLTGLRLGLIDDQSFLTAISERYGAYLTALASGKTLVSAASTKNASQQSYDLIYSGGMMVCMLLDLRIRVETNGRLSLDSMVRTIHERARRGTTMLTLAALTGLINQETGVDIGDVMRKSVRGGQMLEIADALAAVGLRAEIRQGSERTAAAISKLASPTPEQQRYYRGWVKPGARAVR